MPGVIMCEAAAQLCCIRPAARPERLRPDRLRRWKTSVSAASSVPATAWSSPPS
ncbi:MAG: hypothetical protein R3C10_01235 [Pirellulales bacterium]